MIVAARERVEVAAAWRLLALGFTPPTAETLEEIASLAEALADMSESPELEALVHAVHETSPDEAATQFATLFSGTVRVAPYEGSYELDPIRQGRQMADVAAFYRAFGAEAHGPVADRPDFVGCELEFLSFLELRRLTAVETHEDGVEVIEGIRDGFLADHAGRWLPTFFRQVAREAPAGSLYVELAGVGLCMLANELERCGIEPAPLPARRRGSGVEAETFECGAGVAASPLD